MFLEKPKNGVKSLFGLQDIYKTTFRRIPSLHELYEVNANGTIFRNALTKKPLTIRVDMHHSKKGYKAVFICLDKKVRRIMIHNVVAECWLGPKPKGLEIDHEDRNSLNNTYTNLRYVTKSENMKNRKLGDHVINQAKANCYKYTMEKVAKPLKLHKGNLDMYFPSMIQCAKYLAQELGGDFEHYRHYLKQHKSEVYGYTVEYNVKHTV